MNYYHPGAEAFEHRSMALRIRPASHEEVITTVAEIIGFVGTVYLKICSPFKKLIFHGGCECKILSRACSLESVRYFIDVKRILGMTSYRMGVTSFLSIKGAD